jgi:dynein light chain roadblock-type
MTQEKAEQYSEAMMNLSSQARSVVRDLNPKNELKYLRVRAKRHEIMVAFGTTSTLLLSSDFTFF